MNFGMKNKNIFKRSEERVNTKRIINKEIIQ